MNNSRTRAGRKRRRRLSNRRDASFLLAGMDHLRCRKELDFLIDLNRAAPGNIAIQGELAPEAGDDISQYFRVGRECVGIEMRVIRRLYDLH